jgi:hypothetical protein
MLKQSIAPFRMWGYRYSMQAMVLSHQGLVIRNGDDRILIPTEEVLHFQQQLSYLIDEGWDDEGN